MIRIIPEWCWTVTLETGAVITGTIADDFLSNAQRKLHEVSFDGAVSVQVGPRKVTPAPSTTTYDVRDVAKLIQK